MTTRELPFDLYVHILEQLTPSTDSDESITVLISCLKASPSLRAAASVSGLWEPHYRVRYAICDPAKEQSRKRSTGGDWRLMYLERRRIDLETLDILSKIVAERGDGRLEKAREVNTMFSFDAWNVLETAASYPLPETFLDPGAAPSPERRPVPPHAVPTRFWAQMLLGAIARSHAVRTWGKLISNDTPQALELSFACVSSFFVYPPMKVLSQIDELAALCKAYFIERQIPLDPAEFNSDAGKLRLVCSSICDFLWSCGFEAADGQRFHMLQNRFPHLFLTTHKATIPISLVYVFVCIARKMGVTTAPVDFPTRVLAVVSSPDPDVPDIFVDVFGSRTQAILTLQDDIPHFLVQAGITATSMLRYITPASSTSMLVRASRNVLASFSNFPAGAVPEVVLHTAFYASLVVNVIFMNNHRYLLNIMKHINRFLLDLLPVLVDSLTPLLNPRLQEQLTTHCKAVMEDEKEAAATCHPRSVFTLNVKFFVGMVFKHAAHGYVGYIYGWDPSCAATEDWIREMGVDSLSRGRHQPFYHALTQNGSSRYVAEDNIRTTCLKSADVLRIFVDAPEAGRYFEDLTQDDGKARFLLSPELNAAYPDDEAFGDQWLKQREQ
ncbi:YccV-like-domain-containing protein [Suillus clintonianus]|uniref:YccV-like-domain-containing protein n=1 Tax=Suillus clintonianus TaxID=1904413 RepID=UPI001B884F92|nr:YccV-like-domain-containing protein [Suillus clintonianus]KAG2155562.1 YccV-like-domain-containing protein [Suillus clintonianus]